MTEMYIFLRSGFGKVYPENLKPLYIIYSTLCFSLCYLSGPRAFNIIEPIIYMLFLAETNKNHSARIFGQLKAQSIQKKK